MNRPTPRHLLGLIHLWVALILCAPLVLLGLSGSILVFEDDLRGLMESGPAITASPGDTHSPGQAHSIDDILEAAVKAVPGTVATFYNAPSGNGLAQIRLSDPHHNGPGFNSRIDVDPVTLKTYSMHGGDGILRTISMFHSTLLLRDFGGRSLVGWLGVAMLILGATGLVNWWPRPRRWAAAFRISRKASGVRFHRDLHGMIGIWALIVFMIVSFGGTYLAFPGTISSLFNTVAPTRDLRSMGNTRITPQKAAIEMAPGEALALAQERLLPRVPDAHLSYLALPTRPDQPIRLAFARGEQERVAPSVTVLVDPFSRSIVSVIDPRDFNAGETWLAWQRAMHAGAGLGPVWKILVFLVGLLPLTFTVTGLVIWSSKRKNRRAFDSAMDSTQPARRAAE